MNFRSLKGEVILIVLGVLAAISAMLLVGSLRAGNTDPDENASISQVELFYMV